MSRPTVSGPICSSGYIDSEAVIKSISISLTMVNSSGVGGIQYSGSCSQIQTVQKYGTGGGTAPSDNTHFWIKKLGCCGCPVVTIGVIQAPSSGCDLPPPPVFAPAVSSTGSINRVGGPSFPAMVAAEVFISPPTPSDPCLYQISCQGFLSGLTSGGGSSIGCVQTGVYFTSYTPFLGLLGTHVLTDGFGDTFTIIIS